MTGAGNACTPGRWAEAAGPSHDRSVAKWIRACPRDDEKGLARGRRGVYVRHHDDMAHASTPKRLTELPPPGQASCLSVVPLPH